MGRWNAPSKPVAYQSKIIPALPYSGTHTNTDKAQHFFDYELRPQIGEAGSYFYHSHVGFQAVSASGPLIVEEANGQVPFEYDEERMLFLSELFNNTDKMIEDGLTTPLTGFLWSAQSFCWLQPTYILLLLTCRPC